MNNILISEKADLFPDYQLFDEWQQIIVLANENRYQDINAALTLVDNFYKKLLVGRPQGAALELLPEVICLKGEFLFQIGQIEAAIQGFEDAYSRFELTNKSLSAGKSLAKLAISHLAISGYVKALEYTLKGLEIARSNEERGLEGVHLRNLGAIYVSRAEFTRALPYLLRAVQLTEEAGDLAGQAAAWEQVCRVYCGLTNPGAALNAGLKGLHLYETAGNICGKVEVLNSLGLAYMAMRDYPRALECFGDALKISESIQFPYEAADSFLKIADVYTRQSLQGQALENLLRALEISESIRAKGRIIESHQMLSGVYRQTNQFQKALLHYENFHEIKEQVINDENETKIKNLEVVYQVDEAKREAEQEQHKNLALQQEISDRIQAQQALQIVNEQLQSEIQTREQLIGDLNAFARMVAHDLKAPLQNLAILSHLLDRQISAAGGDAVALSLVDQIRATGTKANTIISELLTLASLRNQDIQLQPLDMESILVEVEKRLSFNLKECGAKLEKSTPLPPALGQPSWVEEVLTNYISNALKYGGHPPEVAVGAERTDGRFIRYWVKDNGPGLSTEDQAKLFKDFTRLDQTRAQGHGLGLSIVKRIVEKIGGEVGVMSSNVKGEGCEFWFTLPTVEP